jgi:SET domain-containing protein
MLVVKTSVKPSDIEGLGLFAEEKIPKGSVVWRYDPRFDLFFDPQEVDAMPALQKELIDRYAYLSTETGKYVYCIDDTRFMNHSSVKNNLDVVPFEGEPETRAVANRDIEIGEELLINYRTFDTADATSTDPYLSG